MIGTINATWRARRRQILIAWLAAWTLTLVLAVLQSVASGWPLPMRSPASATSMVLLMNLFSVPIITALVARIDQVPRSRSYLPVADSIGLNLIQLTCIMCFQMGSELFRNIRISVRQFVAFSYLVHGQGIGFAKPSQRLLTTTQSTCASIDDLVLLICAES